VSVARAITRERAERIARAHACEQCQEYSFKKISVKPASAATRSALNEVWHVVKICGVCGMHQEMGLDGEGEVVYAG
jgi:hypothetical protein